MKKPRSSLLINGLALSVNLGWPDIERMHEQIVIVDLDIDFLEIPNACTTDHLDDTVCYSALIKAIQEKTREINFHLVEHLAFEVYNAVKPLFMQPGSITVHITKHPKIPNFTGSVRFSYSDEF